MIKLVSIANYIRPVKSSRFFMADDSLFNDQQAIINNSPLPVPSPFAVADQLHSAAIRLLRRLRKQDVATGEGPARLSALSVLVFGGPKTLGELAAAEQVKPPTMSRIVAALKSSGLITVTADRDDARRMRIRATRKGIVLLHKGRELRVTDLAKHLERVSPAEIEILDQAVEILRCTLENW